MSSLIWSICNDNLLSLRTKNNNDTWHSKIFDLFNNKPKIMFLWRWIVCFAESYYDIEGTSS